MARGFHRAASRAQGTPQAGHADRLPAFRGHRGVLRRLTFCSQACPGGPHLHLHLPISPSSRLPRHVVPVPTPGQPGPACPGPDPHTCTLLPVSSHTPSAGREHRASARWGRAAPPAVSFIAARLWGPCESRGGEGLESARPSQPQALLGSDGVFNSLVGLGRAVIVTLHRPPREHRPAPLPSVFRGVSGRGLPLWPPAVVSSSPRGLSFSPWSLVLPCGPYGQLES